MAEIAARFGKENLFERIVKVDVVIIRKHEFDEAEWLDGFRGRF